jgi:hypothetical protein
MAGTVVVFLIEVKAFRSKGVLMGGAIAYDLPVGNAVLAIVRIWSKS